MAENPLTVEQFAAKVKAKYPQYGSIPDAQLVEKIVTKYPQYKAQIGGASPSAPNVVPAPTEESFLPRLMNRVDQNMEGMSQLPGVALRDARARFLKRHPENANQSPMERLSSLPSTAVDAARSSIEGVVNPAAEGLAGVTLPGMISRSLNKEDPANISADALMMLTPGTEELGKGTHTAADTTKAGSLLGAKTRAVAMMDHLDKVAKDIPVEWKPAYQWGQKAMALEKYGYTVPPAVKAFVNLIDSRMKPGMEVAGPGSFIDRGGSLQPLSYEDARNFESSLGARIDWDDPGGKMNALQKKMRESIGKEVASALKPYGLDAPYLKAKADFTKAYGATKMWGPFGYFGGKLGGYAAGSMGLGHPLMLGYGGGKLGESAAGSIVDSIINAGKKDVAPLESDPIAENTRRYIDMINSRKGQTPRPGMGSQAVDLWQQGVFGKSPEPDIGSKVRQANPEPPRMRDVANPARDTALLSRVRAEHPDWSLSKQLMEAAKRARETGQ